MYVILLLQLIKLLLIGYYYSEWATIMAMAGAGYRIKKFRMSNKIIMINIKWTALYLSCKYIYLSYKIEKLSANAHYFSPLN
jgi:hypothetical protein